MIGLTGGNIFHGELTPDQLFFLRPVPGWAQYRTPIKGLYLCGSGAHPGGGVMGAPGLNAAREILKDWALRRGWGVGGAYHGGSGGGGHPGPVAGANPPAAPP